MRPKFTSLADKLEAYSDRSGGPDACWPWLRCATAAGYGWVNIGGGKCVLAHRAMWQDIHGDIPSGMVICHRCDNPKCINPAHLFLGTPRDNTQDMFAKGRRGYCGHPGVTHPKAKLTEAVVLEIRDRAARRTGTMRGMGREYGVSGTTIRLIVQRKIWQHV